MNFFFRIADRWVCRGVAAGEGTVASHTQGTHPAVVITGGSRGLGLALAETLAADPEGLSVVLVARTPDRLARACERVSVLTTARVVPVVLDLRARDACLRLDEALAGEGLYCDVLVCNAGIGLGGPLSEQPATSVQALIDLNVSVLTQLMHHHLPRMLERGRGGIINIASLGGYVPGPHQALYYASKAFVISLTAAVAYEEAGRGVRIASVAPGPINTTFHRAMGADNALYRWLLPALSPQQAARSIWRGYRLGCSAITPGLANWLLARVISIIPHAVSVPMMALLLRPRPDHSAGTQRAEH